MKMRKKQSPKVWAAGFLMLAMLGLSVAVAFAQEGGQAGTAAGQSDQAALVLLKESDRSSVALGQSVIYTITIINSLAQTDTVTRIADELPAGFTFQQMLDSGDIYTPPVEEDGTLVWDDPIDVPGGGVRRLVYQVRAGRMGVAENSVTAETIGGTPLGPAPTTVTVSSSHVYLPMVKRVSSTLPFSDNFDQALSPNWVVFVNYRGLTKDDWYWTFVPGLSGLYSYEPEAWDGFALSMYLGPGSQDWTNYQVISNFRPFKDKLAGLWIRGTYAARTDMQGGQVGGYYVHVKPQDNTVYLWRIRPQTMRFHEADVVAQKTTSTDISTRKWYSLKVEARGANIKVWMKEQAQPDSSYQFLIDWTDPNQAYMKGTVGFSVFRTIVYYNDISVTPL